MKIKGKLFLIKMINYLYQLPVVTIAELILQSTKKIRPANIQCNFISTLRNYILVALENNLPAVLMH